MAVEYLLILGYQHKLCRRAAAVNSQPGFAGVIFDRILWDGKLTMAFPESLVVFFIFKQRRQIASFVSRGSAAL